MIIAHNVSAINAYKSLGIVAGAANKSMEKLSSGFRINKAGDDAAGLSISEKMRSQIRGLNRASRNAQDGISMIQTAEGGLNEDHAILQRMREIAVQSATDTNQILDREALQNEMAQLTSEINRIGNSTEFNGMKLLNGTMESKNENIKRVTMAKGGDITLVHSAGLISNSIKLAGDGIKFSDNSDGVDFTNIQNNSSTTVNFVRITKSDKEFLVDMNITSASADLAHGDVAGVNSISVNAEQMIKNEDGSYTYNNHGVSFSISSKDASEALLLADGSNTELRLKNAFPGAAAITALNIAGGKVSTNNNYEGDNANSIDIKKLHLSDDYKSRVDYDTVIISLTTGADANTSMNLKVTYKDGGETGKTVIEDTISAKSVAALTAKSDAFIYNANGLSFNLDILNTVQASKEGKVTLKLDELLSTQNVEIGDHFVNRAAYFHVGANANQTISMDFRDMRSERLGLVSNVGGTNGFSKSANVNNGVDNNANEYSLDITTREGANNAITAIDNAINIISQERSKYGSIQNRIEYTINNLNTTSENMQAAESRIRDVDMASEMLELTKNNILQQAAQAMLTQVNQRPQQALQLLQ